MDSKRLTSKNRNTELYQQGVSLIELLIGMVIGLVLLGGITQTMLASKEASATRQSISTITDNARFLFDFMARDLRMGGRGYGGGDWPAANPNPIELVGGALTVRYLDANNNLVEVTYRHDAAENQVEYLSDPNGQFEPLIGGVDRFGFVFALAADPDNYAAGNNDWPNVTAARVTVRFVDEAPWAGEGIDSKEISSTFALRNQVSSLITAP